MIASLAATWRAPRRSILERRDHMLTMLFGTWLLVGLFVDGWAHTNLDTLETFFTPWHALFYSGFGATAAWIVYCIQREGAIPDGYAAAVVGLVAFALGGVGDMTWHLAFGIEKDVDALLSPTHLVLFASLVLILSSPFQSAWATLDAKPTMRGFLPALLSISLVIALCLFFLLYLTPFNNFDALAERDRFIARMSDAEVAQGYRDLSIRAGLGSFYVTSLVLMAPLLLILRRWQPPFGTSTVLFGVSAALLSALEEFKLAPLIPAALAAGLVADVLIRWLQPAPTRVRVYGAFAMLVPVALWSAYFATVVVVWGTWWTVNLVGGVLVMSALACGGLSVLMAAAPVSKVERSGQ
jgi:hypothetical protein